LEQLPSRLNSAPKALDPASTNILEMTPRTHSSLNASDTLLDADSGSISASLSCAPNHLCFARFLVLQSLTSHSTAPKALNPCGGTSVASDVLFPVFCDHHWFASGCQTSPFLLDSKHIRESRALCVATLVANLLTAASQRFFPLPERSLSAATAPPALKRQHC